jgi:hypothetical protein
MGIPRFQRAREPIAFSLIPVILLTVSCSINYVVLSVDVINGVVSDELLEEREVEPFNPFLDHLFGVVCTRLVLAVGSGEG